jgi:NADP-dependent 3-hydroxy acid dehydrogenase YdfG
MLIAYHHANSALAGQLEAALAHLSPKLLVDKSSSSPGQFAAQLVAHDGKVVLLLTDNLLRSESALSELLPSILILMRQDRLLVIVADGVGHEGQPVETHIDRVVYAIQYMNHWQNVYLQRSDQHTHMSVEQQIEFSPQLHHTQQIANQMGDLISALRDADPKAWSDISARQFAPLYAMLGIEAPLTGIPTQERKPTQTAQTVPVNTGLTFQPAPPPPVVEAPVLNVEMPPAPPTEAPVLNVEMPPAPPPEAPVLNVEMPPAPPPEAPVLNVETPQNPDPAISSAPEGQYADDEINRTIEDAWFWIEKGNFELGLGVLEAAIQQYPHHQRLRDQYEFARAKYSDAALAEVVHTPEPDEARSYDAAGDSAYEQGDYLMAKYCWDRAAELAPNLPGIWRKLGILTSEKLTGYEETSRIYLQKALAQDPNDESVQANVPPDAPITEAEPDHISTIQNIPDAPPVEAVPAQVEVPLSVVPEAAIEEPMIELPSTPQSIDNEVVELIESVEVAPEAIVAPAADAPAAPAKIVLITGATSGIGRATALAFAQQGGYRLIVTGRRADRLRALKAELASAHGTDVLALEFDVRDYAATAYAISILPSEWADVDILINNAGLAKGLAPIQDGELAHWEQMIDTNIKGLLYMTRCVSPGMVARQRGHIINICSVAGKEVYANGNVYCATKSAVDALTRSMRLDLHKHHIRVGQVSPGHVEETEFALTRFDGDADRAQIYTDFQPLTSHDVADAILYMVTRPPHVNIQDIDMFGTQQASATTIDRSGR